MHHFASQTEFLFHIKEFLCGYYVAAALLNAALAWYCFARRRPVQGWLLVAVAVGFAALAPIALSGDPARVRWISLPEAVRDAIDWLAGPVSVLVVPPLVLGGMFALRRFFVRPAVAWSILTGAILLLGFSLTDPDFAAIVGKGDNVPIVALVFLLGFFLWLATHRAVQNDDRLRDGQVPLEKLEEEKALVWPDLVYIELICMVLLSAGLIAWSVLLKAPLEAPASIANTPNPSKAPWYFLGLQEMLVYFDPWFIGVVVPGLMVVGLAAIPYLDVNPAGNGYYSIRERRFAYLVFQFGFLCLWIVLILLGTFFRGPNWSFFGPYEPWDPHRFPELSSVNLSEWFWVQVFRRDASPTTPLLRELPGLVLLTAYFVGLPPLLRCTVLNKLHDQMGKSRYLVMVLLLLTMALLPIKIVAHWTCGLKYFVSFPGIQLNL